MDWSDDHGDGRNLTISHLIAAAVAAGIGVDQVIENLQATIEATPGGDDPMSDAGERLHQRLQGDLSEAERLGPAFASVYFRDQARSGAVLRTVDPDRDRIVQLTVRQLTQKRRQERDARVAAAIESREQALQLVKAEVGVAVAHRERSKGRLNAALSLLLAEDPQAALDLSANLKTAPPARLQAIAKGTERSSNLPELMAGELCDPAPITDYRTLAKMATIGEALQLVVTG